MIQDVGIHHRCGTGLPAKTQAIYVESERVRVRDILRSGY
jgi:hypothetical protein